MTFLVPRSDRHGLLPLLHARSGDWETAKSPLFPQYRSRSVAFSTPKATLNVLELDLGEPESLKSLTLSTVGRDPALTLLAVTAEAAADENAFESHLRRIWQHQSAASNRM